MTEQLLIVTGLLLVGSFVWLWLFPRVMSAVHSTLPVETSRGEFELDAPLDTVVGWILPPESVPDVMAHSTGGGSSVEFHSIVRSGWLGLNPADVRVQLSASSPDRTLVALTATAREGLLNQRTAPRAIEGITTSLKAHALSTAST